jgi:voltage-gated potassium channel
VNYFSRALVRGAYLMEGSARYSKYKEFFRSFLVYERSRVKYYFDLFMIGLVLGSVFFLLYSVKHGTTPAIDVFETVALIVFILEYCARVWVHSDVRRIVIAAYETAQEHEVPFSPGQTLWAVIRDKLDYMTTPIAIIDLLAILPAYRPLRILRLFLLFKLLRYTRNIHSFVYVLTEKRFELGTLAIFFGFILLISSSAIYFFEARTNPGIGNFFDAVYWSAVTASTVGYGDIVPKSVPGMVIAMALIVLGVSVLAFLTSIIVSAFSEKLDELKENRVLAEIEKMHHYILICGYGRVGEVTAKMLHDDNERLVIVDNNPEKVALAKSRGFTGICGDASKSNFLQELGVGDNATAVVCSTGSDAMNIFITLTARGLSKTVQIISRVEKKSNRKKFFLAGADYAFSPYEVIGVMGVEYVSRPIAYEALDGMLSGNRGVLFESFRVFANSRIAGGKVEELELARRKVILFGVLRKTNEQTPGITSYPIDGQLFYFNPPDSFVLQEDDRLILMGRIHHIKRLEDATRQSIL